MSGWNLLPAPVVILCNTHYNFLPAAAIVLWASVAQWPTRDDPARTGSWASCARVNWSRTAPRLPFIARFAGKSYESLIRPMRLCEAALPESDGDRRSAEISKLGLASHFPGHLPRLAKIIAFQTGSHGSRDPDEADRSLSDRPVQSMAMATRSVGGPPRSCPASVRHLPFKSLRGFDALGFRLLAERHDRPGAGRDNRLRRAQRTGRTAMMCRWIFLLINA
jgi:hypothetical protein